MKTILLTGATGFLGAEVYSFLKDRNHNIIPLVRRKSGLKGEIEIDLCANNLKSSISNLPHFDALVHLAAYIDFSTDFNPEHFCANSLATNDLALLAAVRNAHFIFTSTVAVYGKKTDYIDENTSVNPDTPYALSKWLGEEFLRRVCPTYTILRLAGIYGRNGPEHLGLNKAISGALRGEAPVLAGSGSGKRNYIFVKDAAAAITCVLENKITGTYLTSGSEVLSIREMLDIICEEFLPQAKIKHQEGFSETNQIMKNSPKLPRTRAFKEALKSL